MPLLSESAPAKPLEIVIPDCCNIGIMVKSLLFVNGVSLTVILIDASSIYAGLLTFIEASMLIELASLSSLFALCGLRRMIKTIPVWGQRIACALVPAAITGLIIHYLLNDPAGIISLSRLSVPEGVVCAALFGIFPAASLNLVPVFCLRLEVL